jgi:hypothetical protein
MAKVKSSDVFGDEKGIDDLVRVWEEPIPPPREWIVEHLVPTDVVTTLYGDGGIKKSLMAINLAMHVVCGAEFYGHRLGKPGNVLFIDAELDKPEFVRRAKWLAAGSDTIRPLEGLFYLRPRQPLHDGSKKVFDAIQGEMKVAAPC